MVYATCNISKEVDDGHIYLRGKHGSIHFLHSYLSGKDEKIKYSYPVFVLCFRTNHVHRIIWRHQNFLYLWTWCWSFLYYFALKDNSAGVMEIYNAIILTSNSLISARIRKANSGQETPLGSIFAPLKSTPIASY